MYIWVYVLLICILYYIHITFWSLSFLYTLIFLLTKLPDTNSPPCFHFSFILFFLCDLGLTKITHMGMVYSYQWAYG